MARTIVVLPTPGPPVTTSTWRRAACVHRLALLGRQLDARAPLELRQRVERSSSGWGRASASSAGAARAAPPPRGSRARRRPFVPRRPLRRLDDDARRTPGVYRAARGAPPPRRRPPRARAWRRARPQLRPRGPHVPVVGQIVDDLEHPRLHPAPASPGDADGRAIRSAVLKPTPHTSSARRYGSRDTTLIAIGP